VSAQEADVAPGQPFGDLSNVQFAGRNGLGEVSVALPRVRMTLREALVHAAWLVLLADDDGEFSLVLDAVRSGT